jgi:signal transduction histidine kinase
VVLEYLPDRLHVTVVNPVPARVTGAAAGHGLTGARERVEAVRGTLTHGRSGIGSWALDADLPTPVPGSHQ